MPTEMELTLEQTQQGVSYEVSNIRVNSFTMKMEILLESTSNKLMVEHAEYDESNTYVLERFNTSAGNPVKKILLKLNLSDHRLCKMVVEKNDSENNGASFSRNLKLNCGILRSGGNDVAANVVFPRLALCGTKFLDDETGKIDKYFSGIPDNFSIGMSCLQDPKTLR
ncbi:hypothetical protein Tco_0153733 [Tanacetum coccineum]